MSIIEKEKVVGNKKVVMLSVVARAGRGNWRRIYVLTMPVDFVFKTTKSKVIEVNYSCDYRVSQSYSSEFNITDRYKNSSQGSAFIEAENIFKNTVDILSEK